LVNTIKRPLHNFFKATLQLNSLKDFIFQLVLSGAAVLGEDLDDVVAASQRRRVQAQLPPLRHPQVS
jgi:hypothetical protein